MERLLFAISVLASIAVSETAIAHPHYDVAAVAGTSAALPFLLGIGIGVSVGAWLGAAMSGRDVVKR